MHWETQIDLPAFNFVCLFKCFFCSFFKIFFVEPKFVNAWSCRRDLIDEVSIDHRIFDILAEIRYRTITIGLKLAFTKISLHSLIYNIQEKILWYQLLNQICLEKATFYRHKNLRIPFLVGNWPIASEFALEKVSKSLQLFLHL